jgi:copper/silver efflux system protein
MINHLITLSIRHRWFVVLASLVLALAGIYAVYHTPIDAIPDLSENQIIVFASWPGHSPQEMEDQVTYPLSLQLQGLAGVRVVRSSSDIGFSLLHLIFEDEVDFQAARRQVGERLAGAASSLPSGVEPQLGPDAAATGQIYWYTVEGPGLDLGRLRALQDWYVKPQLSSVAGVAEVASVGGFAMEYEIQADPLRLRAAQATLNDLVQAVGRANAATGGHVIHKPNAEYVVRAVGWLGAEAKEKGEFDPGPILRDLENVVVPLRDGKAVRLAELATVTLGSQARRGVLEKDGSEVTGGVVLMRQGENPLEVTRRIKQKIQELQAGLPAGVHIVPFYDRTPLIEGAVKTVATTLAEAIVAASVCVLLVLVHFRTSFIVALTLPLATLSSFLMMWLLRRFGVVDIQTNIMSLAGIAISVGVLVDAAIVMAENVMHALKNHFGAGPVRGDVRAIVLPACLTVGRPLFFSVLIMLLSFLPVFALGGMEGKMFRPLAFTKSFALLAAALLAITLVPALCTIFIKGRLRSERESWLVRSAIDVYLPILDYLLDRPGILVWIVSATFVVGLAPLGNRGVFLATLFLALVASALTAKNWRTRSAAFATLTLLGLMAQRGMQPLGREFITPLDEGMIMDMPITIPRASITQSADDLKARDMVFCRFPEVDMVVGKAGRAETPTDPAPLDMIETMINFRPQEFWPRRKLRGADAERQASAVLASLVDRELIEAPADRQASVNNAIATILPLYDAQMREFCHQRHQEFTRDLGNRLSLSVVGQTIALLGKNGRLRREVSPADLALVAVTLPHVHAEHLAMAPELEDVTALVQATVQRLNQLEWLQADQDALQDRPPFVLGVLERVHAALGGAPVNFYSRIFASIADEQRREWREHTAQLNDELRERAAMVYTRLLLETVLSQTQITDGRLASYMKEVQRARSQATAVHSSQGGAHHDHQSMTPVAGVDPHPAFSAIQSELGAKFAAKLTLERCRRDELAGFGGELDRVMQMPGWTNVWTMPIQNRVDMLSTGVNTAVGVRVLGRNFQDVVLTSDEIARVLKTMPGATDVVADPVRGKGYVEVHVDRTKAARLGVTIGDVNDLVETALAGRVATSTVEGRERHPVRVRLPRAWRESEDSIKDLMVPARLPTAHQVPLSAVAEIRVIEGAATIKSENGLLRNYVRLNVRGRDEVEFVAAAQRLVAERVPLPAGTHVEWTGQFEHTARVRHRLTLIVPIVIVLIFLVLYFTYNDWADALLMLLTVPGAIAGGVLFQWLFGYKFSVTVWVGYIACFGMATSTGIIMLVYLREAVTRAGGLEKMTLGQLRQAVLQGAVHRLRPKLLTEGTTVIGLAPLLWATGIGAEVIKPMTAPVLGGILVADEMIDLLLPVLFYWIRRRRWERLQAKATESN